jgi:RNA polymerase nonessential primary-like sigma factor
LPLPARKRRPARPYTGLEALIEVGQEIGLTRERVRQIQVEALRRLREILEKEGLTGNLLLQ